MLLNMFLLDDSVLSRNSIHFARELQQANMLIGTHAACVANS